MTPGAENPRSMELDDFVLPYETARSRHEAADLGAFLPDPAHPLYLQVLRELVRVELEFGWQDGRPHRLEEYQQRFPELFRDPHSLQEIAFEEYRLRRQAGESLTPDEYRRRFDVDTSGWEVPGPAVEGGENGPAQHSQNGDTPASAPDDMAEAARAYQDYLQEHSGDDASVDNWYASFRGSGPHARLFRDVHRSDPRATRRLAQAVANFPAVGGEFCGFRLIAELGRGTFGRVYLAAQGDLADRLVALKVTGDGAGESQTLARLQHTHIVPIHSVHQQGPFRLVCMPYFGATTLADVFRELKERRPLPRSGREIVRVIEARGAAPLTPTPLPRGERGRGEGPGVGASPALKRLEGMTYVGAVLWMGARLAEGLAHAHERGVMHLDLKPANVLLTDDGLPMLLDFNLSADSRLRDQAATALVGGTLPYMAPEHLQAFQGGRHAVDARSDLYSFGVILYELLTTRHPYELRGGPLEEVLASMLKEHQQAPPGVRRWNPEVSPAVESIVRRCLEPDPAHRYQSAAQLQEDLQRQLDSLPLKHAPEPSLRERAAKWARRHPRLTSSAGVAVLGLVLLTIGAVVAALTVSHLKRQKEEEEAQRVRAEAEGAQQEAANLLHQFEEQLRPVCFQLTYLDSDAAERKDGVARGLQLLERYRVLESTDWASQPTVALLTAAEQERLRANVGELLWMTARAAHRAEEAPGGGDPLSFALRLNSLAESCYAPDAAPRVLWSQRAELLARDPGMKDDVERCRQRADAASTGSARHQYLTGIDQYLRGEVRAAQRTMQEVSRHDPRNYFVWLVLGHCHAVLGQYDRAVACYGSGIVAWPEYYRTYHLRARALIDLERPEEARADLDQAVALSPEFLVGYLDRAALRIRLDDASGASEDLDRAEKLGARQTRVFFMRAAARRKLGDKAGADRDFEEGLRRKPEDEQSWIARGLARLEGKNDSAGALADLEEALKVNPQSRDALQNKAAVLSEYLNRPEEAIEALDRAVALYPDFVPARAGRGVLLARRGKREAALQDARESLRRDTAPATLYQVAGIFALVGRPGTPDRLQAFQLLSAALRKGYGFDLIDSDHDLDPLRNDPEFRRLVQAARELRATGGARAPRP